MSEIDHPSLNVWRRLVIAQPHQSAGNTSKRFIRRNRFIRSSKPHSQIPLPQPRKS